MNNIMHNKQKWFTEIHPHIGSAFSIEIEEKLHEEQSAFQHIEIYRTKDFGLMLTIDGTIQLTERDIFTYHEMMSHPILFTHPHPKNVCIIGGGDCGVLFEVLKHQDVESVTQIDIDERITRLAEQYFPSYCANNHDKRAKLLFVDGVTWMKEQDNASLDVIIIDSTDPVGPAEGLFGKRFYDECMRVLRPEGLLIHQSESPLYYFDSIIKPMHQALKSCGFTQTQTLYFPVTGYPSGWWSATMAGKQKPLIQFREQPIDKKTFSTEYYNSAIHRAALALPEFIKKQGE